jgi:hypothetical protein
MKKRIFTIIAAILFTICLAGSPALAVCDGPDCSASGNFDISTFAAGGGIDYDAQFIPNGFAGGLSTGEAQGTFVSLWRWTLGGASADLNSVGGGVTKTTAYTFNPEIGDVSIGVGSYSDSFTTTQGYLHVDAWGLAYSIGSIDGIAGQGSLNTSLIDPSPYFGWDSEGHSCGVAGQGSVGGFVGGAGAALYGDGEVDAGITMSGQSGSESYRAIDWFEGGKTEIMGSNVFVNTEVTSYGITDGGCIGGGYVDGGFVAEGLVVSNTVQSVPGGVATANALGSYSGAGELGCSFNGSANGYTQTSATTYTGYNGSIMSSSAGMQVSSNSVPSNQD